MGRVFSILALLAVAAGCVYVWYGFRQDLATAPDPAIAVPADAVALLRFEPDWRRTPAALHATGEMMNARWGDARSAVQHLDSLRLTAAGLQEMLDNGPFNGPCTASDLSNTPGCLPQGFDLPKKPPFGKRLPCSPVRRSVLRRALCAARLCTPRATSAPAY